MGVALLSLFRYMFKLHKAADTKLYDNDALKFLESEDNRKKLDEYVEKYNSSGKWDKEVFQAS